VTDSTVPARPKRIIVGVTGASGAVYPRRLIECLCAADTEVHLVVSPLGRRLFVDELAIHELNDRILLGRADDRLVLHPYKDVGDPLGSGSTPIDAMIICPCSGNTLAQVAAGFGDNLINRAAQVTLKERRQLVIVHREMPMSHLELQNCVRLSTAGAVICPAAPGFYMLPQTIEDLVDFVVGKVMDIVGVPHQLNTRWTDMLAAQEAQP
jgi:4-hydroxy-3-polyprenylbenzoate decarboxylase